jgi:hypothetical protein
LRGSQLRKRFVNVLDRGLAFNRTLRLCEAAARFLQVDITAEFGVLGKNANVVVHYLNEAAIHNKHTVSIVCRRREAEQPCTELPQQRSMVRQNAEVTVPARYLDGCHRFIEQLPLRRCNL